MVGLCRLELQTSTVSTNNSGYQSRCKLLKLSILIAETVLGLRLPWTRTPTRYGSGFHPKIVKNSPKRLFQSRYFSYARCLLPLRRPLLRLPPFDPHRQVPPHSA